MLSSRSNHWLRSQFARRRLILTALAGVVIVLSVTMPGERGRALTPTPIQLDGVSAEDLAALGLIVTTPEPGTTITASEEDAKLKALESQPGASVRQVVLARVVDQTRVPPLGRTFWVVNLDPATVPVAVEGPAEISDDDFSMAVALVLVEPETGGLVLKKTLEKPVSHTSD